MPTAKADARVPVSVPVADSKAVAAGNNAFAIDLYKALAEKEPGNLIVSPYSVSSGLAMTWFVNRDFAGIAERVGVVDAVEHAATIEVTEAGTVATAATATVMARSKPPSVDADRPFAFLIVDTQSGAVLFVGHVTDPRWGGEFRVRVTSSL